MLCCEGIYGRKGCGKLSSGFDFCLYAMDKINSHGRQPAGGFSRLAYGEDDGEARETTVALMEELGLSVHVDEVGNIRGFLPGPFPDAPPVAMGSHIDTVPCGGMYDGVMGVSMALGVVKDISESCPDHNHPLEVIAFSGEESSRFGVSNIGSKAVTGYLSLKDCFDYFDDDGTSLFKAMRDFGLLPERMGRARIHPSDLKAFFEIHIEQGPFLDRSGIDVGVVEAIAAPTRFSIDIEGRADHSGACPMSMRKDALAAAAEVILMVESVGREESPFGTVATVGVCRIEPGAMNVVPGRAVLKVDLRGIKKDSIERAYNRIALSLEKIALSRKVDLDVKLMSRGDPVVLDGGLRKLLGRVCEDLGLSWTDMPSGAGHDAMYMAAMIPTAMIFVPCVDGISHNSMEKVEIKRIRPGYRAILEAVRRMVS